MFNILKRKWINLTSDTRFYEILSGSAYALAARVMATGFGMVVSVITARFYGADILGIVAILNSFLLLATIFTVLGTGTSILRLIPEHLVKYSPTSAFKVYRKTEYLVVGISLISGTVFFPCSNFIAGKIFSKPHLTFYFALAAVFIVFKSLMLLTTQAVRGLRLIRTFAFMQALPSLSNLFLLVLLTITFFKRDNPVYTYLAGLLVTGIAGCVIMEYAFKRRMQPHDLVQPMGVWQILFISGPMLMTQTMAFFIGHTGVILLGIFLSESEVGYYEVAVKMAMLTAFILSTINSMAAPKFSELFHIGKMDDLFYVARKSTKLIFWTSGPILFGLVFLGKPILSILFGKEFVVAYPSLVFLSIGQFVNSISGSTGIFMNMTGNEKILRNIILGATSINVILNIILIPHYGMSGAALAVMVTMISWNVYALLYIKFKYGRTIGYFPGLIKRA